MTPELGRGEKLAASSQRNHAKMDSALVRAVRTFFPHFSSPETVRESAPSGPEQASVELQVVILEWLATADKLAVHLAQVRQVDHRAKWLWPAT
jgi:hypothetical protein